MSSSASAAATSHLNATHTSQVLAYLKFFQSKREENGKEIEAVFEEQKDMRSDEKGREDTGKKAKREKDRKGKEQRKKERKIGVGGNVMGWHRRSSGGNRNQQKRQKTEFRFVSQSR